MLFENMRKMSHVSKNKKKSQFPTSPQNPIEMTLGIQIILTTDFSTVKTEEKKKKEEMGSLPK